MLIIKLMHLGYHLQAYIKTVIQGGAKYTYEFKTTIIKFVLITYTSTLIYYTTFKLHPIS